MPKQTHEQVRKETASIWSARIFAAQEHKDKWAKKFKVQELIEAYYGFQWDECDTEAYRAYVMNMIFSSIDVKTPSLLFNEPVYNVSPRPAKFDFDPNGARARARLKEDVLNYFAQGGIEDFSQEVELCILDAWFAFGVLEIGYSADYVMNPNAGKPYLVSDRSVLTDKNGKVVEQPEILTDSERLYARRIPSERFFVGGIDPTNLNRCSWYGYIDYIRKEDLLASAKTNDGYNVKAIHDSNSYSPDSGKWNTSKFHFINELRNVEQVEFDVVTVWKIYDMRSKRMYMFNEDVSDIFYSAPFNRPKHFAIKFRPMLKGWYPLPIVFNWISPQSEINETREAARIHRRRFQRKYVTRKGAFEEEELEKLINGGDGTWAQAEGDANTAVVPVPSANLTAQHDQAILTSRDDFNIISGTSAEQRGQSDRTTATQSQIKERRSAIRESRDKEVVGAWLCQIGKEILLTARENLVLPFWVKISQDTPGLFEEANFIQEQYEIIASEDLGDEDFNVKIRVSSMSPIDQAEEKERMVEFLSIVSQFPQVAMSPVLVQEIADRTGFRNERAVADLVRMAQLLQTNQLLQLAAATGQDPTQLLLETFMRNAKPGDQNPAAQRRTAQMTPPDMETIQNQIGNQLSQPSEGVP